MNLNEKRVTMKPLVLPSKRSSRINRNGIITGVVGVVLLLAPMPVSGQPLPSGDPVSATVDAAKTGTPISPYVYGQFLEHIGNLMYGSLWSEMLDDRKFYYPVQPKPPEDPNTPPRGRRWGGTGPGRWNPVGPSGSVEMDTSDPFVGVHTPMVRLAGDEPRGIRQTGIVFEEGATYQGRIQITADPDVEVAVHVVWGAGEETERQVVHLPKPGQAYRAIEVSFDAEKGGAADVEIVGTGAGTFHVGAASLMPADNVEGFRLDAIAALKSLRSGVYRFPGGNFVSAHEWRNAIGDPDRRPTTWDPVRRGIQSNDIGTDEFLTLCRLIGVEPYITVNAGTGDAWSAAQYVEYTNGDANTPMGQQRAENGHPEPYRVEFWGIGNEMWGLTYQFGAMKLNQFVVKHNEFDEAMRRVDPTIQILASGAMPDTMTGSRQSIRLAVDDLVERRLNARGAEVELTGPWESFAGTTWGAFFRENLVPPYLSPADWTGGLLENCFDHIDYISEHFYNYGNTHFSLAAGRQVPNDPDEPVTEWMRRAANHIRIKYEEYLEYEKRIPRLAADPKPLAISEWAYTGGKYPTYPALAWTLHEMFRHSDLMQMATYTFATSLLTREGQVRSLNTNGRLFKVYRDHFGSIPVDVTGNSPQPAPSDPPGGEQPVVNAGSDTFPLDVVAAWTADQGALTVAVLNPTDTAQSLSLTITGVHLAGHGTVWRLASSAEGADPDISENPVASIPHSLTVGPFSVNIFKFPTK